MKGKENLTIIQTGVKHVTTTAKKGWGWLLGSWWRPLVAVMVVCAGVAALALTVFGAPDWEALDDVKDAIGTRASVADLKKMLKANPKDGPTWVELGHAEFDGKNRAGAVRSYARALALDSTLASDRVIDDLVACYGDTCQAAADELIARYKLVEAEPKLEPLTRNKKYSVRYGAIRTLERLGRASNNDYLHLWTTDLVASSDCDVIRHAVEQLGKLGDKRALDEIRAAKKKDEAETPWYRPSCLGGRAKDAEEQILARK